MAAKCQHKAYLANQIEHKLKSNNIKVKKMKTLKILSFLLIMSLIPSQSFAGTQKGDIEVTGLLYLSSTDFGGDSRTSGSLISSIGYFYSDKLEFKVASFVTLSGGDTFGSIGPGVDYHFNPQSDTIYYMGGSYQVDVGDTESSDRYDVHFGLKRTLTERVDMNLQLGFNESTDSDQDFSEKYASLGISYYF